MHIIVVEGDNPSVRVACKIANILNSYAHTDFSCKVSKGISTRVGVQVYATVTATRALGTKNAQVETWIITNGIVSIDYDEESN